MAFIQSLNIYCHSEDECSVKSFLVECVKYTIFGVHQNKTRKNKQLCGWLCFPTLSWDFWISLSGVQAFLSFCWLSVEIKSKKHTSSSKRYCSYCLPTFLTPSERCTVFKREIWVCYTLGRYVQHFISAFLDIVCYCYPEICIRIGLINCFFSFLLSSKYCIAWTIKHFQSFLSKI